MENCGQESGAWIVLKSTDVNDEPMFALGHRRGGVVHYFISSHGQTLRGKDQAHKEDLETVEGIMAPRPCPKILNDVTLAQPKIDSNNRYRQEILAIEESLRTDSFPMRFLTTIWGMEFVDAFRLNKYFNKDPRPFKSQMKELAHKMLTNEWDEYHGLDGVSLTRRGLAITIGPGAPGGRSPQRTSPRQLAKKHALVAIASIEGWQGSSSQLTCSICKDKTTMCCIECSSKDGIVALCKSVHQHGGCTISKQCLKHHRSAPDSARMAFSRSAGKKRMRPINIDAGAY